ncbi:helix-turn-helix domain-containing protein [Streptomyces anulatus]
MSRNDIARQIKRSASTVSKLAAEMGLSASTAPPKSPPQQPYVEGALTPGATEMAHRLHDVGERELGRMTTPTLYWEWGSKDHTCAQKEQPEPTPASRRTMMATAGALDSLRLLPPKTDPGEQGRSVVSAS